jgi:hypothetical protein
VRGCCRLVGCTTTACPLRALSAECDVFIRRKALRQDRPQGERLAAYSLRVLRFSVLPFFFLPVLHQVLTAQVESSGYEAAAIFEEW